MPLHIQLMGNDDNFHFLGNRIFQHLVALNFLELLDGDVVVRGSNLPHFFEPGILTDDLTPWRVVKVNEHKIDFL